ncbi:MAG: VWA domain-containing protein, partial [bacterium]|nr:VWA domain-containing protein [bacterium]
LPSGRRSLRSHWANFLQTQIQQAATGPRGFGDEGVTGYCCKDDGVETAPIERFFHHYGHGARPRLQSEVAGSDAEIARRMNELLLSESLDLDPFAMHLAAITLPGATPGSPSFDRGAVRNGDPEFAGVTRLFVQAVASNGEADDWVGAAVTQSRGARDARGPGIDFASKAFMVEPRMDLGGKPAARTRLRWFGRKTPMANVERLWLAFASLATDGRQRTIELQTVVTPFFEPTYGEDVGDDPRGTRTVSFIESLPEREDARFRPGDRLTLEIDASDYIHEGDTADIPESRRALEARVADAEAWAVEVEDVKVWLADAEKARYRIAFTLPKEVQTYGEARAQITLRSLLKLGVGDRNDASFPFELARIPPEVSGVRVEHEGVLLHERGGDAFRPVPPGETRVRIEFDREMDRSSPPRIRLATPARRLPLRGTWSDDRVWEGGFVLPEDASFDPFKGYARLEIHARSAEGEALDSDPEEDEAQPDDRTRLLVGGAPPILRELRVLAGGAPVYEGRWVGGPDLSAEPSWARVMLDDRSPTFETRIEDIPSQGSARVELVFSNPLRSPPSVRVGSLEVPVQEGGADGDRYAGSFDLEAAHEGLGQGAVLEVEVDAIDSAGNRLDADPRTPSSIGTDPERPWIAYEALVGQAPGGEGGPDRWHGLAAAPRMSLVIVLDLSGSMEGGRLANAKSAILALLDQLPHSVELALVTFNGCTPSSIGFTRDVDAIRAVVEQAKADGSTGYAAALLLARDILATKTHPSSQILKYAPFSDGEDTCSGDPIAAIDALETLIAQRRGEPSPVPVAVPAAQAEDEEIACEPGEWEVYEARVRSGGLHLDRIRLVETRRLERRLPDGHCEVTVIQESYGVMYGQLDDAAPNWRVHNRSSTKRRLQATSRDPEAERSEVEKVAKEARARGSNLATARLAIERAVHASLARNHRPASTQPAP